MCIIRRSEGDIGSSEIRFPVFSTFEADFSAIDLSFDFLLNLYLDFLLHHLIF